MVLKNRTLIQFLVVSLMLGGLVQSCQKSDQMAAFSSFEGEWIKPYSLGEDDVAKEVWSFTENGQWTGLGVTIEGSDTLFLEYLHISQQNGEVFYIADVDHNPQPIKFKWDGRTNPWKFDNPEHDFPKYIQYRIKEDTMSVEIGDGTKSMNFTFVKANKSNLSM